MSDYDKGLADGYMQGLARAQQLIAQALADGLPEPEAHAADAGVVDGLVSQKGETRCQQPD